MHRKLILVIDQDKTTCELIEERLNGSFEVLCIPNGNRALEVARKSEVDIAILARCLPQMNGLDILKAIKKEIPLLPVVFVASEPDEEFIISAFRAGAKDFFIKPIDADSLMASVKNIIKLVDENRNNSNEYGRTTSKDWHSQLGNTFNHIKEVFSKRVLFRHKGLALVDNRQVQPSVNLPTKNNGICKTHIESIPLRVNFLGNFHIILNEQVIDYWPSKKGKAILAYLTYHHKRRIYKDKLMDIFWPNSTIDAARNSLNVALHGIRQLFHEISPASDFIQFRNDCYFLNPEINTSTDVEEFQHYWKLAQSTEREKGICEALGVYELAAALYKGDFMEEDIYEDWTTLDRENLKEIYLVILDRLSKYYSSDGKPITAVNLCRTILEKDCCREDIHRRLMQCLHRLGQRDKAIKQFIKCKDILKSELEVNPTRDTLELYEQIKNTS